MKLVLLLAISCLAVHHGRGAPTSAVYKFVRCNPEGDQANCVTHQTQNMPWNPELPNKLPASNAEYLEAEPVEDEEPLKEEGEEEEEEMEEDELSMLSEEGESPVWLGEESSGGFEGSADEGPYVADRAWTAESEAGSGESEKDAELYKVGGLNGLRRLFPSSLFLDEAQPAEEEFKEEHLLQL